MICVISTAVYATEFFLFKTIQVQSELEHNIKVMELNTVSLEHQKNIAIRNAKKTAVLRHNLRHTGQMILAYLDKRDIDGARRLIRDIDTNIRVAESMNVIREVTGHKLLDLVLSYYTDFATESGVDISVCMSQMDDFDTDMAEFAVVLSNALENAVNACLKLPEGVPRVIRVNG